MVNCRNGSDQEQGVKKCKSFHWKVGQPGPDTSSKRAKLMWLPEEGGSQAVSQPGLRSPGELNATSNWRQDLSLLRGGADCCPGFGLLITSTLRGPLPSHGFDACNSPCLRLTSSCAVSQHFARCALQHREELRPPAPELQGGFTLYAALPPPPLSFQWTH